MLEQRLAWEIRALESSKAQLLAEGGTPSRGVGGEAGPQEPQAPSLTSPTPAENLARAQLKLVEQRLLLPPVVEGAPAVDDR